MADQYSIANTAIAIKIYGFVRYMRVCVCEREFECVCVKLQKLVDVYARTPFASFYSYHFISRVLLDFKPNGAYI